MAGLFKSAASRRDPAVDPRDDGSVQESAAEFRSRLEDHLTARAELFGIEAREAASRAARKGALGLAAAGLALGSYAFLVVATVSLLGRWLERAWPEPFAGLGWQIVAILCGGAHLLLAFALVRKLRRSPTPPLFQYTLAEFQQDREWLKKKQSGNRNDDSP
jgi:uncharacterized membrane protein YqjE